MLNPIAFLEALVANNINFVTGVPDSLLKDVCACFTDRLPSRNHIIATNEGAAIGLAIGHYLGTGNLPVVYMQNSGLGNATNPLASLADPLIFGIPMLLLIGWRGEVCQGEQLTDEPQHRRQGLVTLSMLDTLSIPYEIIDSNTPDIAATISASRETAIERSGPVAIVVRKNTFSGYSLQPQEESSLTYLTRESAIQHLLRQLPDCQAVVATTGMASREVFEFRAGTGGNYDRDFLTVGGMGHASQIAAGIALAKPDISILCLDGDGAALMHLGGMATAARLENLIHVVLNNGSHDSVGGQPTALPSLPFSNLARCIGYATAVEAWSTAEISEFIARLPSKGKGAAFLEIHCKPGARSNLGRPNQSPSQNKTAFMTFIHKDCHEH